MKKAMKTGGMINPNPSTKVKPTTPKMKKGGMVAFEKSSYDKKMDASGAHSKEGSAKDMKSDKAAAKKLGYMKKGGKKK